MAKVSNYITNFNEYVTELILNLKCVRGVTYNLLTNLWKVYTRLKDFSFVAYIHRKHNAYDEGEDIEVEDPIRQAENKYQMLILNEK